MVSVAAKVAEIVVQPLVAVRLLKRDCMDDEEDVETEQRMTALPGEMRSMLNTMLSNWSTASAGTVKDCVRTTL